MPTYPEYKAGRAEVCAIERITDQGAGQDPQNQMGIMRTSESVNLMMASQFLSPADLIPMDHSIAAKDREIARLREALERVLDFDPATPGPSSTAEDLLLGAIAIARAALAQDGRE